MRFRTAAPAALFLVGFAAPAFAQPVAPPRPSYSPYYSLTRPGGPGYYYGGYGGYGGFGGPLAPGFVGPGGFAFGMGGGVNPGLLAQLNQTNQAVNNLQTFLAYGVNPMYPATGRGAVFNDLGHWYPQARYTTGLNVGGGVGGGFVMPTSGYNSGLTGGMNRPTAGYSGPGIPVKPAAGGAGGAGAPGAPAVPGGGAGAPPRK